MSSAQQTALYNYNGARGRKPHKLHQGFIHDFTSGGVSKNQGPPLPPPFPFPPFAFLPLPSLPLEVGPFFALP